MNRYHVPTASLGVFLTLASLVVSAGLLLPLLGFHLPGWVILSLMATVVAATLITHAAMPRERRTLERSGIDPAITGEPREEQHEQDRDSSFDEISPRSAQ